MTEHPEADRLAAIAGAQDAISQFKLDLAQIDDDYRLAMREEEARYKDRINDLARQRYYAREPIEKMISQITNLIIDYPIIQPKTISHPWGEPND